MLQKVLLLCLFLCSLFGLYFYNQPVFAQPTLAFPDYQGFVSDFENILSDDQTLEQQLGEFEKESTVEIAIVTVADFQGTTIEDYAVKLFEQWKIGKEDVDNGLLISVSAAQRQSKIEVGYGLEGVLPDALTGRVQDEFMVPRFIEGNYDKGMQDGINALIGLIKEDPTVVSQVNAKKGVDDDLFEILIFALIFFGYVLAGTRSWWLGGVVGAVLGGVYGYAHNLFYLPILAGLLGLLIDYILSRTAIGKALYSSRGIFHPGSGSGRSGGGFSFGGGSSGGGGSSRSW